MRADNGANTQHEPNILLWMPLIDVDSTNGCLTAYPGTHRFGPYIVVFPQDGSPYADVMDLLAAEYGVLVPMKAGQALLYDGRLLHSSEDNRSTQIRTAVSGSLLPAGVTPTLFTRSDRQSEVIEVMSVEELTKVQFAMTCTFADMEGVSLRRTMPLPHYPKVTAADLEILRPLVAEARTKHDQTIPAAAEIAPAIAAAPVVSQPPAPPAGFDQTAGLIEATVQRFKRFWKANIGA